MTKRRKVLIGVVLILAAGLYYYVALPAVNLHSSETWFALLFLLVILAALYLVKKRPGRGEIRQNKVLKGFAFLILALGIVYLAGTLLSSPIVNAKKFQQLMKVEEGEFTEDIEELSFDQIPILDRDTAAIWETGRWEAWWTWYPSLTWMIFTVRSITRTGLTG